MHRNTDCSCLISDCSCDCLANPPCCIRTELISFFIIKLLNSFDQTKVTFLNQIQKQHTTTNITFCNADNQSEVRLCQLLLCLFITGLHPLCQFNLFLRRQQWHLTNLLQIHTNRVFDADTIWYREINLLNVNICVLCVLQNHVI